MLKERLRAKGLWWDTGRPPNSQYSARATAKEGPAGDLAAPGEEGEEEATAPEGCSGGEGVTTAQAGAVEGGTGEAPTGAEEEEGATRTGGDLTEEEEESPDEIVDQLFYENTKTIIDKTRQTQTFYFVSSRRENRYGVKRLQINSFFSVYPSVGCQNILID